MWLKPLAHRRGSEIAALDQALVELGRQPGNDVLGDPVEDARLERPLELVKKRLRRGKAWLTDERVIDFTEDKRTLDYLVRRLRAEFRADGRAIRELYGGMDDAKCSEIITAFNASDNSVRVLVATAAAASEGLNLQETARLLLH